MYLGKHEIFTHGKVKRAFIFYCSESSAEERIERERVAYGMKGHTGNSCGRKDNF